MQRVAVPGRAGGARRGHWKERLEIPIRKTLTPTPNLSQAELAHLVNLIEVLLPHPGGLRRWSVMRAVRSLHEKAAREIPLKLEDEVERVFRRHGGDATPCADADSGD